MRARLQSLIDYTGLSIGEAASVCGVGHDALSKKLRGVARYDVRDSEIAAMEAVAAAQDRAVAAMLEQIGSVAADRVVLTLYRHDADLPPEDRPPYASAQRMIAARIARARPDVVSLVVFDRAAYAAWRGDRPDTRARRAEWTVVALGNPP